MQQLAKLKSGRFAIPIIYMIVGITWILSSDNLLTLLGGAKDTELYVLLSSAKGVVYVTITAVLLGVLVTRFEENLIKSEKQFRNMYLSNPYPIWFIDPDSYRFLSVNDAAVYYYGYTKTDFLKMTIFDIHQKNDDLLLKHFFSRTNSDQYEFAKWCHIKRNGQQLYVNVSSLLTTLEDKPAIAVFVIDISEKVAYEQNLAKSQNNLESTLSSISDSYFTLSHDWVITSANANFYERTGTTTEVIGMSVLSVFPAADETVIFEAAKRAMVERIPTKIEAFYGRLNKWLHVACYPTEEGIAVYFTDISERKAREAEIMRQNEQLRKVSWLNSHEIRKPVASIISLVDLLKTSIDPFEQSQIIDSMQKCTSELDQLLHEINKEASKV